VQLPRSFIDSFIKGRTNVRVEYNESFSSPERSDYSDDEAASALAAAIKQHRDKHGKGKNKAKGGRASSRVAHVIQRPKSSAPRVYQAKGAHIRFADDDSDAEAREFKKRKRKSSKPKKVSCSFFGLGSRGDDSEDENDDDQDKRIRRHLQTLQLTHFLMVEVAAELVVIWHMPTLPLCQQKSLVKHLHIAQPRLSLFKSFILLTLRKNFATSFLSILCSATSVQRITCFQIQFSWLTPRTSFFKSPGEMLQLHGPCRLDI